MADSVDKQGDSVVTLLDSGLIRYALGERDQAIQLWQQALEQEPGDARALDYLQSVGALPPSSPADDTVGGATLSHEDVGVSTVDRSTESMASPFTAPPERVEDPAETGDLEVEPVVADVDILVRDARDKEESGDLELALKNCEEALRRDPDHAEAIQIAEELRKRLEDQYLEELQPLDRVPYLRATDSSILELSLDPVGGFLISQIDGEITVEELLMILGTFDRFRVLSSLHFFLVNEIIEFR